MQSTHGTTVPGSNAEMTIEEVKIEQESDENEIVFEFVESNLNALENTELSSKYIKTGRNPLLIEIDATQIGEWKSNLEDDIRSSVNFKTQSAVEHLINLDDSDSTQIVSNENSRLQNSKISGDLTEMYPNDRNIILNEIEEKQKFISESWWKSCPMCYKKLRWKTDLDVHLRMHTGETPFDCPFCVKKCSKKSNIKSHVHSKHPDQLTEYTKQCKIRSFKQHLRNEESTLKKLDGKLFQCGFCCKRFPSRSHLENHIRMHTGERPFSCPFCAKKCSVKANVRAHVKSVHPENLHKYLAILRKTSHENINENSQLSEEANMIPTFQQIHYDVPRIGFLACRFCLQKCLDITEFKAHERKHAGDELFQYAHCEKEFGSESCNELKEHIEAKLNGNSKEISNVDEKTSLVVMESSDILPAHKSEKLSSRNICCDKRSEEHIEQMKLNKKIKWLCSYCSKEFTLKQSLQRHEETHLHEGVGRKKFNCTFCSKIFSQKWTLSCHMKLHTGEKLFECNQCNKKFSTKWVLTNHERIHKDDKPFVCKFCSKKFMYVHDLNDHERIHTGDKPFKCPHCYRHFGNKKILRIHQLVHTDLKPFFCSYCDKKFRQKRHLEEHIQIHTGKKFKCDVCEKKFARSGDFNRHMKNHKQSV